MDRWKIGVALVLFGLLLVWLLRTPPVSQLPTLSTAMPITLDQPLPGRVDTTAAQIFRGTAPANSPVMIVDAQLGELGRTLAQADGRWTLETGSAWTAGAYRLQAVTLDPLTGQPVDASVVVPVVALSSPSQPLLLDGADLSQNGSILLISGQAPPGVMVSVLEIDGEQRTPLGQAQADGQGRWQLQSALPTTNPFHAVLVAQDPTGAVVGESDPMEVVLPIALTPPQPADDVPAIIPPTDEVSPVAVQEITPVAAEPILPASPSAQPTQTLPLILQPSQDSQVGQADVRFGGTALAASRLRLEFIAGPDSLSSLPSAQVWVANDGRWAVGLGESLPPGRYQVMAVALDPAGEVSGRSAPVDFEVVEILPQTVPAATASFPPTQQPAQQPITVGTRFPRFSGLAEANRLLRVQIVDGAGNTQQGYVRAGADGRWMFVPIFPLAPGITSATVQVVGALVMARDDLIVQIPEGAGFSGALATSLQVIAPEPGLLPNRLPAIYGLAPPGAQVSVRINDLQVATAQADAQGNWYALPPAPLAVGEHWLVVRDDQGDDVGPLILTVPAQTPTLLAPALDPLPARIETARFPITGVAQPGQAVSVWVNGIEAATVVADAAGQWQWQLPKEQAEGPIYVQARILGADGTVIGASAVRVVVYYVPQGG